jgi:hypothetical protein
VLVSERPIAVTLPFDTVRLMLVQPFLQLQQPLQEPFPLDLSCITRMTVAIDTVFTHIAAHQPHFVVFPEFAIPGVAGVRQIAAHLSRPEVASPTITIGGVSGLSPAAFTELCGLPEVDAVDAPNAPDRVHTTEWVNTSVTFVKDDTGAVRLWLQPKLSPSWPETQSHHQAMFKGGLVRVFRGRFQNDVPFRFLSLLCFDWVGREDGTAIPTALLRELNALWQPNGTPVDLQWVFVLQHNESPNHATFLASTQQFLVSAADSPFARRKDTGVVMASTASASLPARGPGGRFGYSSLVFGPQAPFDIDGCWPTVATRSSRLRQSGVLGTCKDTVFREMGECLHLARVRVPNFIVANPTDRTPAVETAWVLPLVNATTDPRLPGSLVPAVVKWTNDELDCAPDFCTTYFAGAALEASFRTAHQRVVGDYRRLNPQDLAMRIDNSSAKRLLAPSRTVDPAAGVDTEWDADERSGLHHVVQTLTLFGGVASIDATGSRLHARTTSGVEIAAIVGHTHRDCLAALNKIAARTHSPIVLVSRDSENAVCSPREAESFADPRGGSGIKLADAQTLLTAARMRSQQEYEQYISELTDVGDRRII